MGLGWGWESRLVTRRGEERAVGPPRGLPGPVAYNGNQVPRGS